MMGKYLAVTLTAGLMAAWLAFGPTGATAQQNAAPRQRDAAAPDRPARDQAPGGERGQRGARGERFDPERMRQMMTERMKEVLGATDEEWKAIGPLLEDVMAKQTAARAPGFGGMFRRGGPGMPGGPGGPEGERPGGPGMPGRPGGPEGERAGPPRGDRPGAFGQPDPEVDALQKALDSKDTPAKDIEAKLKALRDARNKHEEALKQAREKLRAALTIRQEATLVLTGMLD